MNYIIEFCSYIFTRIVNILDSISLPGSLSLLHYFLGAIIIGFIFRLVKGGATEFEANTNFLNSRIVSGYASRYRNTHEERKQEVVDSKTLGSITYINENERRIQETLGTMTQLQLEDRWRSHGVSEELIRLSRGDD